MAVSVSSSMNADGLAVFWSDAFRPVLTIVPKKKDISSDLTESTVLEDTTRSFPNNVESRRSRK